MKETTSEKLKVLAAIKPVELLGTTQQTFAVRCDDCKAAIRTTSDIDEAYAGGLCDTCKSKGVALGSYKNTMRYEYVEKSDPDRQSKLAAQREQFSLDARAGKVLCLTDLMISHGM